MPLVEDHNNAIYQITAYEPHDITINGKHYFHSVILSANALITDWHPAFFDEIQVDSFKPIFELNPQLVILGTGRQFVLAPPTLLIPFYERKIGIECMNSKAACRTFMALTAENRAVVAAIII